MPLERWFLTRQERTGCDGRAWSTGNQVRPLVHGESYFRELLAGVEAMCAGDLLLCTDWRSDPDERLDGPGTEVSRVLAAAAASGVLVRRLAWRPPLVVLRHPGQPARDVAYLGGIDLRHGRRDGEGHAGDPQPVALPAAYGPRPPWHDVQLAIRGPAVGDVEAALRARWTGPARLPAQPPDPPRMGTHAVQLLSTDGRRGERSVAVGYRKALRGARELVYVEDRHLWSADVAAPFAEALTREPELRLIVVLPPVPDRAGRLAAAAQVAGRHAALAALYEAGGARVGAYTVENHQGTPVYVHAKVCVIDDTWACVGSADLDLRSWTRDSALSAAVVDRFTDAPGLPATLRAALCGEHLDQAGPGCVDLRDGKATFTAFTAAADALDAWHAAGRVGPRPPGRLRHYHLPPVPAVLRSGAGWLQNRLYDRDGRPRRLRRAGRF